MSTDGSATAGDPAEPPESPEPVRALVAAGHDRLLRLVSGLSEEQARAASTLPGWSRAHVLVHLADLARAFARQTRAALAGQLVEVYDGGRAARDASIESGASRPPARLVGDVRDSCAELDSLWADLAPHQWSLPTRYRDAPLHEVLLCRWREVEVHTSDLDLGRKVSDWPPRLCAHLVSYLLPRTPPGVELTVVATDSGRRWVHGTGRPVEVTGDLTAVAAWLAGRAPEQAPTSSAGQLPELGPWP